MHIRQPQLILQPFLMGLGLGQVQAVSYFDKIKTSNRAGLSRLTKHTIYQGAHRTQHSLNLDESHDDQFSKIVP